MRNTTILLIVLAIATPAAADLFRGSVQHNGTVHINQLNTGQPAYRPIVPLTWTVELWIDEVDWEFIQFREASVSLDAPQTIDLGADGTLQIDAFDIEFNTLFVHDLVPISPAPEPTYGTWQPVSTADVAGGLITGDYNGESFSGELDGRWIPNTGLFRITPTGSVMQWQFSSANDAHPITLRPWDDIDFVAEFGFGGVPGGIALGDNLLLQPIAFDSNESTEPFTLLLEPIGVPEPGSLVAVLLIGLAWTRRMIHG